jgi:hypothetical protein
MQGAREVKRLDPIGIEPEALVVRWYQPVPVEVLPLEDGAMD